MHVSSTAATTSIDGTRLALTRNRETLRQLVATCNMHEPELVLQLAVISVDVHVRRPVLIYVLQENSDLGRRISW